MTQSDSVHLAARLLEESERTSSEGEVRAYLTAPVSDDERNDVLSLVRWFRPRYPKPADRLAYIRRADARWQRAQRTIGS